MHARAPTHRHLLRVGGVLCKRIHFAEENGFEVKSKRLVPVRAEGLFLDLCHKPVCVCVCVFVCVFMHACMHAQANSHNVRMDVCMYVRMHGVMDEQDSLLILLAGPLELDKRVTGSQHVHLRQMRS